MERTKPAQRWIDTMRKMCSSQAVHCVVVRAQQVCEERKGRKVSKADLEKALEDLSGMP